MSIIRRLLNQGIRPDGIVLLSPHVKENLDIIKGIGEICSFQDVRELDFRLFREGSVKFSSIQNYKGMESTAVIVFGVRNFSDEYSRFLNYIAISRAKVLLYFFHDESSSIDLNKVLEKNIAVLSKNSE